MLNLASKARPYFGAVVLTAALLTAGGIYSATRMPSGIYPEVTFPRIAVVAHVPGLAVANMEVQVTRPLEQAVATVLGVSQVRSKTIRGASELSIDFNPGTDMIQAQTLTWNRISAARSGMPKDTELTVDRMTPSIFPILSVVLTGGDNPSQLRDYAFYQLAPQIKNIPDVLYANVAGCDVRQIEVEPRPNDLFAAGLSAADLADQIGKAHQLQPVGRIERAPLANMIIVDTQASSASKVEDLIVSTKNNQPLRVRDVADVKVGHEDRILSAGYGGKDAVVISVYRSLGGNTVNVSRDVRALLQKHGMPPNVQATVVYDQARFVTSAVHNVRDAILIGGAFSILILLAFLRSWRATLISALAIPTTLAITFLFLHWTGETLNLMSLGGLAVAIGLIIDDTVVVVENIARHLSPGTRGEERGARDGHADGRPRAADPVDAASREITGAVIGSTLTTVLVFVPLAFIIGVYGQFFASLSWSLSIAVLVSMVISLTLVPVFAARFLAGRPMPGPGPVYRFLAHVYEVVLAGALRVPWLTLAASVAAIGVGVLLFTGIKRPGKPDQYLVKPLETGLMPAMDEGGLIFDYWAPSGTPLQQTEEMLKAVEKILSDHPDIEAYVRRTGSENGIFATESNRGDITIILRPAEENPAGLLKPVRPPLDKIKDLLAKEGKAGVRHRYRRRPVTDVKKEIEDAVTDEFSEHQLKIDIVQVMQDELNDLSGANKPIEVKFFGPDYGKLRELAEALGELIDEKKKNGEAGGIDEVNTNVQKGNPDLMVRVDQVRAARLGLRPDEITRQLQAIYVGQIATQVRESSLRITDVRVRYPNRLRFGRGLFDPNSLLNQLLLVPEQAPPPGGVTPSPFMPLEGTTRAVPLSAVATVKPVRTPNELWRENQQPFLFVSAELDEKKGGLGTAVADVRQWMDDMLKKEPLPAGYRWEMGGHYLHMQEAFKSLFLVMVVAVLLVFIMLAFQFRSVVLPLLIFLTQPLSLVSGLFALWLTDTPLNISSYMGAILLIGLDMKNGILLVEYIQQLRQEGMELRSALILAGRTRFRPILMTSLAAILGLFPLALGIGPGAQMQRPLAIMVIGGLTANMLFTRMVIPVGYLVLERRKRTPAAAVPAERPVPQPVAAAGHAT